MFLKSLVSTNVIISRAKVQLLFRTQASEGEKLHLLTKKLVYALIYAPSFLLCNTP